MRRSRSHISGILLMCRGAFAFSLMALLAKWASQTLPSLEVVFFRSLIGSLMLLAVMRGKRISILGRENKVRGLMILRGVFGFAALSLHFYTIAHLPLGTAVMLNYTGPLFAAVFAVLFLKEKTSPLLAAASLASFTGVYLLVEGGVNAWSPMVFLGLLSAVFVGVVYVLLRALKRSESPFTVIFYFTAVSTFGSAFFLPFGFEWPGWREWLLLAGVGISSFYGQLWLTLAIRRAPASLVSPFSYFTPVLSFLYGVLFWGDLLNGKALTGILLIVASGSVISWFETRQAPRTAPPSAEVSG